MTAGPSSNPNASLALVRLLQLASPALPVGAYSYSQGLEAAIESGVVTDRASAERWIGDMLRHSVARLESPVWLHLHAAWSAEDAAGALDWNDFFLSTRESAELRAETVQMGYSLRRLLNDLEESFDARLLAAFNAWDEVSFPAAFTFAAAHWEIPANDGLSAYLWSWLENQVMAAVKAVPLGQTDGQRMLARLGGDIVITMEKCPPSAVAEMNNYCHGLAIASSVHETQYSRLFRS